MDELERELKIEFLTEALSMLEEAEGGFLSLEENPKDPTTIDSIFRIAHNLKGTSRAVGFSEVSTFTHATENILLKLKENKLEPTRHVIDVLLECKDHISTMIHGLNENLEATFESEEILEKIEKILAGDIPDTASEATEETSQNANPENTDNQPEASFEVPEPIEIPDYPDASAFEEADDGGFEEPESTNAEETPVAPPIHQLNDLKENPQENAKESPKEDPQIEAQQPAAAPPPPARPEELIKISLDKVEDLNNIVGELVILHSVLVQAIRNPEMKDLALKTISQLGKLSREIQEASMSLRMIPIRQTMQKMRRIVRDTSKALNKEVDLEIVGEDTEIDKTVLDRLNDPLVHIVRNAVDHGLDDQEARAAAGKPEQGQIKIQAGHEGDSLFIEVTDDGKGIDPEVIFQKAVAKKIVSPNANLTDQEKIHLIFSPSFSTKDQVTEVSGRGVGMDVVRTNIESLGGSVAIDSKVGRGSRFKIRLPLTMAIIDGLIVKCLQDMFIVPLGQISEMVKVRKEELHTIKGVGQCMRLRGEIVPLIDLSNLVHRKKQPDFIDCIALIVRSGKQSFAFTVEDIIREQQIVVKTLGGEIINKEGYMGGSIMGDGRPALIIDLKELLKNKDVKTKRAA